MDIDISIIIPVYNTPEDKIKRCVNSVLTQTFQYFEIIIVDDGSSLSCADKLDLIASKDKRIRVIHKENEGSAVARNVGIMNAACQYLMFVDSDDFITSYALEDAAKLITEYNPDMVMGLVERFVENDETAMSYRVDKKAKVIGIESEKMFDEYVNHMLGYPSINFTFAKGYVADGPVAKVCKTNIVREALFNNEAFWNDDTIWNLKVARKCKYIVISSNIWYAYLVYESSKTRKYRENCLYEFKYRINQELQLVKTLWPNCLNGIYTRIWRDITILCRTFLFHNENKMKSKEKYKIFKEAIHTESYIEMLRNIDFSNNQNIIKKFLKQMIRFFSLHGPNYFAYFFWKCDTMKNYNR